MRPVLAFLFAKGDGGQWSCQVFRDWESLLEATVAANDGRQRPVGVHVGFVRPDTDAVAELLSKQGGLVFLSTGAMGTMPSPVRASQSAIGSAGGISFHAAIDGFGYQLEDHDGVPSVLRPPSPTTASSKSTAASGWVALLATSKPELAQRLGDAGIWDEESYLLREAALDVDTRHLAGLYRYEILEQGQPEAASLVEHLGSAPPWLLIAPIEMLELTPGSSNVCAAHGIKVIGDFAKYGPNGLCDLPKLGPASVLKIGLKMFDLLRTGRPLRAGEPNHEQAAPERPRGVSSNPDDDCFGPLLATNIIDGFIEASERLTQRQRRIWFGRMGFRCDPMTLQQIADHFGVTRERIRQIEVSAYRKVNGHPFWGELSRRVQTHLHGRTSPLFLQGIAAIDPWFEGVDSLGHALREMSANIPHLGFHILTWNDAVVISRMSQQQWLDASDEAKNVLLAIADQRLSERDALAQVKNVVVGKGEDMSEALVQDVSDSCVWSLLPDGTRILTGYGTSVAAVVTGILYASDAPLHIEEIHRRACVHATYEAITLRTVHQASSKVGLLFGRGTYGLMKHCPIEPTQMMAIRAEVEDIVAGGSPSKQWHSSEIYAELLNRGCSYEGKLTKYIINIAVAGSPNLVYLRRMIWGVRGHWTESASSRLAVKQAVVSVLEDEGTPLTTAQIRSRLIEGRGLNSVFQIWPSSPLVRLGPGLWGLEGRDVNMEHAEEMAYCLLQELSARQEGMHVSEAAAFLGLSSEDEVSVLTSIANKDGLRIDKGQYCYLQPWGDSRRISAGEAVAAMLKEYPDGLSRTDLHSLVERVTKRKVSRQQVSSILQDIDAIFDARSSLWKQREQGGTDNEEDEGGQPDSQSDGLSHLQ